jgi:hypothetical protein
MFVTLLFLGCDGGLGHDDGAPAPDVGDGLFLGGCPREGLATARMLTDVAERPWGPDALAAPGDVLLMNARAAFVIQSPEDPRTYYHYGGTPIDAVPVQGCDQEWPDVLGEQGFLIGRLDLTDFQQSTLHMFRGDRIEIVSDGSDGGPAIVDVHGSDDRFWLVELTLMRDVYQGGGRKTLGDLYGVDVTVRYTLDPGDPTLQMELMLDGEPVDDGFLVGGILFPSDYTTTTAFTTGDLSIGGIDLDVGVPWMGSGAEERPRTPVPENLWGATAFAMPGAAMARTEIAGVTSMIDIDQVASPLNVGDSARFALAVGPTDAASAAAALEPHLDDPVPGYTTAWHDVGGTVTDGEGRAIEGAVVSVQSPDDGGEWRTVTTAVTDADGKFAGRALAIGDAWRLVASGHGRDDGDPVEVPPGEAGDVALRIGPHGSVTFDVTEDGVPIAARVELERDDGRTMSEYPTPLFPNLDVPPGHWTVWVTRGYEYEPVTTEVDVPDDGTTTLEIPIEHVVDTTGWVSFDSHVHAGPSPDSPVLPIDRMRTVAGAGLDVMIGTDHEAIVDLSSAVDDAGLGDEMAYVLGSEITASLPEHTNAWPFPAVDDPRGDPVRWYQMGFPGIYAAERERGARVVQLNHSRVNHECGILCVLDWDRGADDPHTDDPEALGLPAGTEIWSWDFDSFEVLNGLRSPFVEADDPRHTGALMDWLAFLNLGHRVTAVGVTDEHGMDTPGAPRTVVAVADDRIGVFTEDDLADAVLAGAAEVSAGAFGRVSIDGAGPGDMVSVNGTAPLAIHVEAPAAIDVTRVDVLVNCDTVLSIPATDPAGVVKLDTTVDVPIAGDAHVVVMAMGEGDMPRGLLNYSASQVPRLVVNPIYVDGDGDGVWTAPGAKSCDVRP